VPIYEFYCSNCHTLYNFFSASIDTEARPDCPRCDQRRLERRPARFATLKHQGQEPPDPFANLDEDRLTGVLESMMGEFSELEDNEDPRRMAALFRRFGEASGLQLGPRMEEMMSRLEAGEDPDLLEQEIGDELDDDEALEELFRLRRQGWKFGRGPKVDDTLYFL
jgi:putative FmdB family regulatory protein